MKADMAAMEAADWVACQLEKRQRGRDDRCVRSSRVSSSCPIFPFGVCSPFCLMWVEMEVIRLLSGGPVR